AVAAMLSAIAQRSAPRSRAIVLYHRPAPILRVVGLVLWAMGEPLRSTFEPEAMHALLAKHGFTVVRDESVPEIAAALSDQLVEATKVMRHMRLATADRDSS
ncbi:MAG TPA: hypothetical protein VK509_20760, partial [Polyangiales bacterium]|nr:hypothetical protein [Polyangiales bacterium]